MYDSDTRINVQTAAENNGTEDDREFTISSRCWHASDIRALDGDHDGAPAPH